MDGEIDGFIKAYLMAEKEQVWSISGLGV
jgi:hypothetical protein